MAGALKQRIEADMKAALLERQSFVVQALRGLKAAILNDEVAAGKREEGLEEAEVEKIIAREVKKRRESVALYEQNGRAELAEDEKREIEIFERYLPEQLDEEAIRTTVKDIVDGMGGASMQQMGQVIGAAKAKLGNAADGATVAKVVKDVLSA